MSQKYTVVHIEIPAKDRRAGATFYADVFGWPAEHMDAPMPYTTLRSGNEGMGIGMPDVGEQTKPNDVIVYISSEDVEADLKKIEAAGGKRLSDSFKVGDFGEMAMFTDPTGNRLALWKDLMQQQSGG